MSRRTRRIVTVLALCVAVSVALGAGSYSSVSADRSVSVAVVAQEDAYLGVPDDTLTCGNGGSNVLFRNQFAGPITDGTVAVTPQDGDLDVQGTNGFEEDYGTDSFGKEIDGNVSSGEAVRIHLTPVNDSADEVTVDIGVSGPGFDVSTTATRAVECEKQLEKGSAGNSGDPPEHSEGPTKPNANDGGDGDGGEDGKNGDDGDDGEDGDNSDDGRR